MKFMMLLQIAFTVCAFWFEAWTGFSMNVWLLEFYILFVFLIAFPISNYDDGKGKLYLRESLYLCLWAWFLFGKQAFIEGSANMRYLIISVIGVGLCTLYVCWNNQVRHLKENLLDKIWENKRDTKDCEARIAQVVNSLNRKEQRINSMESEIDDIYKTISLTSQKLREECQNGNLLWYINEAINLNEARYQLLMLPLSETTLHKNYRLFGILRENEILSVFHLCQYGEEDLRKFKGVGTVTVERLSEWCNANQLYLGMDVWKVVEFHDVFHKLLSLPATKGKQRIANQ